MINKKKVNVGLKILKNVLNQKEVTLFGKHLFIKVKNKLKFQ